MITKQHIKFINIYKFYNFFHDSVAFFKSLDFIFLNYLIMRYFAIVSVILSVTLLTLVLYKYYYNYIFTVSVKSNLDNRYYRVKNTEFKQDSADTMAELSRRISVLLDNLKQTEKTKNTQLLLERYNSDNLIENIDTSEGTSYTLNKGSEIAICLSDPISNRINKINDIMFVIIHELAHIGCESDGHNEEFVTFFIFLLRKSVECGVYSNQDYKNKPANYCGISINNNPSM